MTQGSKCVCVCARAHVCSQYEFDRGSGSCVAFHGFGRIFHFKTTQRGVCKKEGERDKVGQQQ